MLTVLNGRLAGELDRPGTAALATRSRAIGARIFGPAAIVTLLAGIGMLAVVELGSPLWVVWGMSVVFASFVLSGVFIRRLAGRLADQVASEQSDPTEIAALRSRLGLVNVLNLLLLLSAVWAMVVKPV